MVGFTSESDVIMTSNFGQKTWPKGHNSEMVLKTIYYATLYAFSIALKNKHISELTI